MNIQFRDLLKNAPLSPGIYKMYDGDGNLLYVGKAKNLLNRLRQYIDTSKLENQAAAPYVPKNGVVLEASEIEFTPGESVFDILLRAAKERNIHMEFRDDNLYSGKYIEGINYLYEMDGGPLSGWMYKVNGKFPNYGCAAYKVKDGDIIVWMYTCDLGQDVGDNSTW